MKKYYYKLCHTCTAIYYSRIGPDGAFLLIKYFVYRSYAFLLLSYSTTLPMKRPSGAKGSF